jgi:C1A family cysteine protease
MSDIPSNNVLYKFSYEFQEKDARDYTHKTEPHPNNLKLEVTTLAKPTKTILKVVPISPPTFTIANLPPILNQGILGTCVANAFSYCVSKQTNKQVNPSRLCLYAICRSIDYTPLNQDDGTSIRSACQAIANYGVCQESVYPYTSSYTALPSLTAFTSSKKFRQFTYLFISQDLMSIKNSLRTYNSPIIFGIMIYSSFLTETSSKTGIIPLPDKNKDTLLGGHCMTIVGYNDTTQMFTCGNSWGTNWGVKGYCYIPYKYLIDRTLASDFCVTTFVF